MTGAEKKLLEMPVMLLWVWELELERGTMLLLQNKKRGWWDCEALDLEIGDGESSKLGLAQCNNGDSCNSILNGDVVLLLQLSMDSGLLLDSRISITLFALSLTYQLLLLDWTWFGSSTIASTLVRSRLPSPIPPLDHMYTFKSCWVFLLFLAIYPDTMLPHAWSNG